MPDATPLTPDGPFPMAFGRFLVTAALGRGAMGTVYRAVDVALQRDVALKVPHPELVAGAAGRARFLDEARAAARLDHPNFCRILDVRAEQGTPFLVLAFVPGRPLTPTAAAGAADAARLVHTLARALADAHHRGVVHRDLKPANVLLTDDGTPVITDFGLALRLDTPDANLPAPGELTGTVPYMAPEQLDPTRAPVGPAADVYALGVLLYEQLTGRRPFTAGTLEALMARVLREQAEPPSRHRPGLPAALDAVCLRALAKEPRDRFADMTEFAGALADFLLASDSEGQRTEDRGQQEKALPSVLCPLSSVPLSSVRFAFVGYGSQAPESAGGQDRLFLDVGNRLGPGVLDHHHLTGDCGSTASLVLTRPALVAAAVNPGRGPDDPFTVVLHEHPDFDAVASACLALHYLETGRFPPAVAALAHYADRIDAGYPGLSLAAPFSPYAAYRRLGDRLAGRHWNSPAEPWQRQVREGLTLLADVLRRAEADGRPLAELDAFDCAGLFTEVDRQSVRDDVDRYRRKLADPRCAARRARLLLPARFGGNAPAEALLVREVSAGGDSDRCVFFKDWARTDADRAGAPPGFTALSVFHGEGAVRRCILSVAPGRGVSLRGLGAALDRAEAGRRRQVFGVDDRTVDPATGAARPPRTGYDNADPWYDGRAHDYTIVDAPRAGTLLRAEEIETIFLHFGGWEGPADPLGG